MTEEINAIIHTQDFKDDIKQAQSKLIILETMLINNRACKNTTSADIHNMVNVIAEFEAAIEIIKNRYNICQPVEFVKHYVITEKYREIAYNYDVSRFSEKKRKRRKSYFQKKLSEKLESINNRTRRLEREKLRRESKKIK